MLFKFTVYTQILKPKDGVAGTQRAAGALRWWLRRSDRKPLLQAHGVLQGFLEQMLQGIRCGLKGGSAIVRYEDLGQLAQDEPASG